MGFLTLVLLTPLSYAQILFISLAIFAYKVRPCRKGMLFISSLSVHCDLRVAMVSHLLIATCAAGLSLASNVMKRQSQTATVNLSEMQGAPQHFASGFLYGIPDTPDQIPAHFYTEIAFNYGRAGGAQLSAKGYMDGVEEYQVDSLSL